MTFGMTTLTSPTTTSTPTTKVETMHQAVVDGVLPDSTVTELSLATGKNWTWAFVVVEGVYFAQTWVRFRNAFCS